MLPFLSKLTVALPAMTTTSITIDASRPAATGMCAFDVFGTCASLFLLVALFVGGLGSLGIGGGIASRSRLFALCRRVILRAACAREWMLYSMRLIGAVYSPASSPCDWPLSSVPLMFVPVAGVSTLDSIHSCACAMAAGFMQSDLYALYGHPKLLMGRVTILDWVSAMNFLTVGSSHSGHWVALV